MIWYAVAGVGLVGLIWLASVAGSVRPAVALASVTQFVARMDRLGHRLPLQEDAAAVGFARTLTVTLWLAHFAALAHPVRAMALLPPLLQRVWTGAPGPGRRAKADGVRLRWRGRRQSARVAPCVWPS